MTFSISLFESTEKDWCPGSITLGKRTEQFHACLTHFDRAQYEQQWMGALRIALIEQRPTALLSSVNIAENSHFLSKCRLGKALFLGGRLCPHTDISACQNAASCTDGRFDGPHCSMRRCS
jgi:hypothetical protein